LPGTTLRSASSGVLPMRSRILVRMSLIVRSVVADA
jgi:hypothetical protein